MAGPVTITCAGCGAAFAVPTRVVRILGHQVLVRMDRSELYGHTSRCPGFAEPGSPAPEGSNAVAVPDEKPNPELAGRIHLMLSGGHFMSTAGSGACTMCGVNRGTCLEGLRAGEPITVDGVKYGPPACCGACQAGNTHPAPQESWTCQQWAAEHGARS